MQKFLFLFLAVLIVGETNAQPALIKDPDGYCNIRQNANSRSKILDTLSNNRIVFVYKEQAEGDWLPVDYKKGNESLSGYLHKSRIAFLTSLTKFKKVILNDSVLELQLDSIEVTMRKASFTMKGREIKYDKPQGKQTFVKAIDNKFAWGTDGNIPKKTYQKIQFKSGNETFNFPDDTFRDLFEPNFNMTMAYLEKSTGKCYIEAINSDGAGGYVVIWIIEETQVIGREAFIPF